MDLVSVRNKVYDDDDLVLDFVALDSYNGWLYEFDPELLLSNK